MELAQFLNADPELDSKFTVMWNAKTKKILIGFYGGRTGAEQAKDSIKKNLFGAVSRYNADLMARRGWSIKTNRNVTIHYFNRTKITGRLAVRRAFNTKAGVQIIWDNGKWMLP